MHSKISLYKFVFFHSILTLFLCELIKTLVFVPSTVHVITTSLYIEGKRQLFGNVENGKLEIVKTYEYMMHTY